MSTTKSNEKRIVLSKGASNELALLLSKLHENDGFVAVPTRSYVSARAISKKEERDEKTFLSVLYENMVHATPAATLIQKSKADASAAAALVSQELTEANLDTGGLGGNEDITPPHNFHVLSTLPAVNVMHFACIEAKARDIASNGYTLERTPAAADMEDTKWNAWKDDAEQFLHTCTHSRMLQGAPIDVALHSLAMDYESLGCCGFEILRSRTGMQVGVNHIPFSTMRVAREEYEKKTGVRFIQTKGQTKVGFLPFGKKVAYTNPNFDPFIADPKEFPEIDKREQMLRWADGLPLARTPDKTVSADRAYAEAANEFYMMARPPFTASQVYGTPSGLAAISYIFAQLKIDEYNIQFFSSKGVPQYAVILEGLTPPRKDNIEIEEGEETKDPYVALETELNEFFTEKLMSADRSVLLVTTFGEAKCKFQKLADDKVDAAFGEYEKRASEMIRLGHGVPGAAIGILDTANLGSGRDNLQMRRYYEHAIVPDQRAFENTLNLLLRVGTLNPWVQVKLNRLDIEDRAHEEEMNLKRFTEGAYTLDEYLEAEGTEPVGEESGGNLRIIRTSGVTILNPNPTQAAAMLAQRAAKQDEALKKIAGAVAEVVGGAVTPQDGDDATS